METVYLASAVVGGTLLVCQFVMTLLGLGHHDIGGAGIVKRHVETRHRAVHDELVIVDHLEAFDGADASPVAACRGVFAARVALITPQGMIVHDIFGAELAVAVVELHPFTQLDAP